MSLQKRWSYIQQETNIFFTAIDHVVSHKVSGLGIVDVVRAQRSLLGQPQEWRREKEATAATFIDL
jgi:hypothetical protein